MKEIKNDKYWIRQQDNLEFMKELEDKSIDLIYGVGSIHKTNEGFEIKIINKPSVRKREIVFLDEYKFKKIVYTHAIQKGAIKNPYKPNVAGVGFFGEGDFFAENDIKYNTWKNIIIRSNDMRYKKENLSYINTSVDIFWHNYQNFAKWHMENFPYNIKNIKFEVDKDLLQFNKKNKIYSKDTCIFLPHSVNSYLKIFSMDKKLKIIHIQLDIHHF